MYTAVLGLEGSELVSETVAKHLQSERKPTPDYTARLKTRIKSFLLQTMPQQIISDRLNRCVPFLLLGLFRLCRKVFIRYYKRDPKDAFRSWQAGVVADSSLTWFILR